MRLCLYALLAFLFYYLCTTAAYAELEMLAAR